MPAPHSSHGQEPACPTRNNRQKTKRKNKHGIDQALRESEHRFRTLFESANDGMLILRKDRIIDCNPQAIALFKGSRRQILGKTPHDLAPPFQANGKPSKNVARQKIKEALEGRSKPFDWRHKSMDGTLIDTEINLSTFDIEGRGHVLAIIRDTTKRNAMQKDLEEKSNSLEKTNAALQAMLDYRETEKQANLESMLARLEKLVHPYLDKLLAVIKDQDCRAYLRIIKANLESLVPSSGSKLSNAYVKLSPLEIKIVDLIRQGYRTKQIAEALGISAKTTSWYRGNIRKKLNLTHSKTNLQSYLSSLR